MTEIAGGGGTTKLRFEDADALQTWLEAQPSEVGVLIAGRAVLRVAISAAFLIPKMGDSKGLPAFRSWTFSVFLASALARVAVKYPIHRIDYLKSAGDAASELASYNVIAAAAALAAYSATIATDASAFGHAESRADQLAHAATHAAANAVRAAAQAVDRAARAPSADFGNSGLDPKVDASASALAHASFWKQISVEANYVDTHSAGGGLADTSLWWDETPTWFSGFWELVKNALPIGEHWEVWQEWYDDRITGLARGEAQEMVFARVPEELWKNPAAANAWIAAELEKLKPQWTQTLSTLIEAPLGNRWMFRNDRFQIDPKGDESDIEAAGEPVTRQLFHAIQRKAESFGKLCAGVDDRHGWSGLEAAIARFHEEVSRDIDQIPAFIASVYDATVELGSFLDLDNAIRAAKNTNATPLDPEVRRAFADLIRTAAPWVRGFPTARELDDQTGAFLARKDLFEPASRILAGASAQSLISDHDRDLILALLAAIEREGFVSHKAGVRGVQSVNNLTLKSLAFLAAFYSGAISSGYSNESPIVKKISDFLVAGEVQITEILADAPADVRLALKAALDDLKRRPPVDIPPPIDGIGPSAQKK